MRDAAGHVLSYRVTNIFPQASDSQNKGIAYGELIFHHDFARGEQRASFTDEKKARSDSSNSRVRRCRPCYSDQTKRAPSLSSGMGPGLSARISPVCGSMRRKRLVANDISTSSPVGVSIH